MNGKYRFGKLEPRVSYKTLRAADYFTSALAAPPKTYSVLPQIYQNLNVADGDIATLFPMDDNDTIGDCTIAGVGHLQTVFNGMVGKNIVMSAAACKTLYFKLTGGPDSGLDMMTVLDYWTKNAINGDTLLGYMSINIKDREQVKQAIRLFGAIYIGFQCQALVIQEFDWDQWWKPGKLTQDGHCVIPVEYNANSLTMLTWGGLVTGSWGWWNECVDEAYVLLPPQAQASDFDPGFNFAQLQADLATL